MLARSLLLPVFCMMFGEAMSSAASAANICTVHLRSLASSKHRCHSLGGPTASRGFRTTGCYNFWWKDEKSLIWFRVAMSSAASTSKTCTMVPIPDVELKLLQNISVRLDTFLDRNVDAGHQRLKEVLTTFGVNETTIKVNPNDPLESVILQYQMALHQEMKQMFFELKKIISGRWSPDPSDNEVDSKISAPSLASAETSSSRGWFGLSPFLGKRESYSATDFPSRPSDCSEILVAGNKRSGVYDIYPFRCRCTRPVKVFCDMETDGGGWTVFLSRLNASKPVNFTRNWADYRGGFGTPGEEHWLGNENLFSLTSSSSYVLRMEAKDEFGREIWGEWNEFKVESEKNKYKATLTTPDPQSTAYDKFSTDVNGKFFTTFDADNDKYKKRNCAVLWKGGWWYNNCHAVHPTGIVGKQDWSGLAVNPWSKTDSTKRYATWLQLKIRPKICSSTVAVANFNTHNCNFG